MNGMGCMSCYCPLYYLQCPGTYSRLADGRKDCSQCTIVHREGGWEIVQQYMSDPKPDTFIKDGLRVTNSTPATNKPTGSGACIPVVQEE